MKLINYGPEGTADSMRLVDGPTPTPGAGEILIEVKYAGVNRPDVLQRKGRYEPPPGASPVLGLEVAGRVVALGANVLEWKLGDSVCALVHGGGYAQFCVTAASHALPVPQDMSLEQAAAFPENWFTVWGNLMGAEVIVTAGSEQKCDFCRSYGAALAINYHSEDFVARTQEFTGGQGVDVVLDMVGGPYIPKNIALLRQKGRLVFVAFLQGSRCEVDFTPIMLKRLRVTGSTLRPRTVAEKAAIRDQLAREIWPAYCVGKLKSNIFATFPLERVREAHLLMESSKHIGKILLQVS
jgi:NADPH2:quinone reductase